MALFSIDRLANQSPRLCSWLFRQLLLGIYCTMYVKWLLLPAFRRRLQEKNFSARIQLKNNTVGRTLRMTSSRSRVGPSN